jgi:hypothetical protein
LENKKLLSIAIIILALGIVFGSVWIGYSLQKSASLENSILTSVDSNVLNISQVSKYLNMTEEEVQGIIQTEKTRLEQSGSFTGGIFPYFIINDKRYFYKNEIDEWLKEVSKNRRQYNTEKGWILQ